MGKSSEFLLSKDGVTPPMHIDTLRKEVGNLPNFTLHGWECWGAINGHRGCAINLLVHAQNVCELVESFRLRQPTLARQVARMLTDWPVLAGRHKAAREGILPKLKGLQLAEDHPAKKILACDGKGMDLDGELNSVALDIWKRLLIHNLYASYADPENDKFRALPPFSSGVFNEWWNLGWKDFVKSVGNDPFNDQRLKRMKKRIDKVANNEGVSGVSRVATEVRKAAKVLWPQMAGTSDKISV